jgi:cell division protein FtsW (lipid II flippase)
MRRLFPICVAVLGSSVWAAIGLWIGYAGFRHLAVFLTHPHTLQSWAWVLGGIGLLSTVLVPFIGGGVTKGPRAARTSLLAVPRAGRRLLADLALWVVVGLSLAACLGFRDFPMRWLPLALLLVFLYSLATQRWRTEG